MVTTRISWFYLIEPSPPIRAVISSMRSKGNGGSQSSFLYAHLAFFLLLPKILVGIMLPRNAASKIHGITLASKQSKRSIVTASGFFIVTPRSPAVTTAAQNAAGHPLSCDRTKACRSAGLQYVKSA